MGVSECPVGVALDENIVSIKTGIELDHIPDAREQNFAEVY